MVTKVTSEEGTIVYQYNGQGYLFSVTNVNADAATSALPDVTVQVRPFAYTAYGEQMGMQKVSGFACINLRARQYEPAMRIVMVGMAVFSREEDAWKHIG